MDERSLRCHDMNRVNGHHTLRIAESRCANSKSNTFTVECEKTDYLTNFIIMNYHKIIYYVTQLLK